MQDDRVGLFWECIVECGLNKFVRIGSTFVANNNIKWFLSAFTKEPLNANS